MSGDKARSAGSCRVFVTPGGACCQLDAHDRRLGSRPRFHQLLCWLTAARGTRIQMDLYDMAGQVADAELDKQGDGNACWPF